MQSSSSIFQVELSKTLVAVPRYCAIDQPLVEFVRISCPSNDAGRIGRRRNILNRLTTSFLLLRNGGDQESVSHGINSKIEYRAVGDIQLGTLSQRRTSEEAKKLLVEICPEARDDARFTVLSPHLVVDYYP